MNTTFPSEVPMNANIQDFLGNLCMLGAAWIVAGATPRRKHFWIRTVSSLAALCILRHVYFELVLPLLPDTIERPFHMMGFSVLLLLTAGVTAVTFECDFWAALFCGSVGYGAQNICNRVYSVIFRLLPGEYGGPARVAVFASLVAAFLLLLFLALRRVKIDRIVVNNEYLLLSSLLVIGCAVVLDMEIFLAIWTDKNMLQVLVRLSSAIISTLIMALQFGMVTGKRKELELDAIKAMMEEERKQYLYEKSMIEMVNIKCHDLKHQLASLDAEGQRRLREDLRPVLENYDSSFCTGNVALDVVLTRENFNCREKNVKLTCVANGQCLSFMSEVDVYSLFGNILDNAIEATEKLEDPEKRIISLSVTKEGYFVSIHAENYYCDRLTFTDGLPETTKLDTVYHGYGLKSIRMLVNKYDGSLKINTNEDRFVLDILFSV